MAEEEQEQQQEEEAQEEHQEEEDREPGGSDGDAVRARKEYRARKRLEAALSEEREKNIRMEERLRALEEARQQKPPDEKTYTLAQVRRLVDEGEWTQDQADEYWEKQMQSRIERTVEGRLKARETEQTKKQPIERAAGEIEVYKQAFPDLLEHGSARRTKVQSRFDHYVKELGYEPNDIRTELLAIRDVLGPVDKLKKRTQQRGEDTTFHAETPAGGEPPRDAGGSMSQAPEGMVRLWDALRTPKEQREKEFALWKKRHSQERRAG